MVVIFIDKKKNAAMYKDYYNYVYQCNSEYFKENFIERIGFAMIIGALLFLTSCNKSTPDELSIGKESILIYLIADNDLSDCVNFTVESIYEGVKQSPLGSEVLLYVDSNTDKPYLKKISRDLDGKLYETQIITYEEQISTSSSVMEQVLSDMLTACTYSKYGLVIWSHGNGWYPGCVTSEVNTKWVGLDGSYSMNINTLKSTISDIAHFDYILFDACYMGGIETFYELKDCADFIIASPSSVMAQGFPYHRILKYLQLGDAKGMIGACDQYISFYKAAPDDYRYASICCVKCSEIDSLSSVVKCGLSESMLMSIDQLPKYQAFDGPGQYMYFDFLDYYSSIMNDGGESLRIQLDKTVLYKSSTPQVLAMNPEMPIPISNDFCGISSYIPHQNQDFFNYCFFQTAWYNSITNH